MNVSTFRERDWLWTEIYLFDVYGAYFHLLKVKENTEKNGLFSTFYLRMKAECRPASWSVDAVGKRERTDKRNLGGNVGALFCLPLIPYFSKPVAQCG